jgi:protein-S-isoprenylcysteine O-methyltransferase Ste14
MKDRFSATLLYDSILTSRIGAALCAAGLLLVLPGFVSLGRSLSVGLPEGDTILKTAGIYRLTRNPIYLGAFVACVGSCLYALHLVNILLTLTTVGIHHWIITREETFLEQRFGQPWLDYKRRVPRYLGVIRKTESVRSARA